MGMLENKAVLTPIRQNRYIFHIAVAQLRIILFSPPWLITGSKCDDVNIKDAASIPTYKWA